MFTQSVLPNGDLKFTLTGDDLAYVECEVAAGRFRDIGDLVCDYDMTANGELYSVLPEWIGALTDAPIFTDELGYCGGDSDRCRYTGRLWWFPDYQILNELQILIDTGEVIFTLDPEE